MLKLVRTGALLAICVISLTIVACGDDDASSDNQGAGETSTSATQIKLPPLPTYEDPEVPDPSESYRIVALVPHQFETTLKSFVSGLRHEAAKYDVKLEVKDAGGYDHPDVQVSQFENAVGSRADAIIVLAANADGLGAQVKKATDAGIPVIGAVTGPTSPAVTVSIDDDIQLQGELMAKALANAMGGEGDAYFLVGGAGSAFNRDLTAGGKKALKDVPGVKIAFEKSSLAFNPADVLQATERAIVAQPDVGGILTSTIAEGQAANKAIMGAGREAVPFVATAVQTKADLDVVREGEVAALGVSAAVVGGRWAIDYAIKALEGEQVPKHVPLPPGLVTRDNLDQVLDSGLLYEWAARDVLK